MDPYFIQKMKDGRFLRKVIKKSINYLEYI